MSFVKSYKNYYQFRSTWVSYRLAKKVTPPMEMTRQICRVIIPPANEVWGYIGITPSVCLSVRLSVRLSRVNLTLAITFQPIEIRLSYYTCWFLVTRPFCPYQKFDLVTLTLTFDLLLKKLNLGYNI